MIASVQVQSYPNWELCIADDCSSDPRIKEVLTEISVADARIKVVFRDVNGHIAEASNTAIDMASGDYIALLDHDDLLDRDALFYVVKEITNNPDVAIIYTDEDKISDAGKRYDPHFKPDWNRLLLTEINYVSHLGVYQSELIRKIGGFRKGFEGAQDYDLLLRCLEHISDYQIKHIPKVLYTWRATQGSTASSSEAKPYASEAGRRAIEEHLARTCLEKVVVEAGPFPFTYKPLWPVHGNPLVSIVIPTRDNLAILQVAVESILSKTLYENFEIIIIDNGSEEEETLDWFEAVVQQDSRVLVRRDDQLFNYSKLNNAAVFESRGDFIVLMNNDIEVISPDWLHEMLALAQREKAGCIGAKLYYPDNRMQHAGVIIGLGGVAGHSHKMFDRSHAGYFARLQLRQNYTAVTAACLMVSRHVYDTVGGLNETDLTVAFNDVDLCLKVRAAGYENAWTPYAEFYHHESVSRGGEDTPEKKLRFKNESDYMKATWNTDSFQDPAYNPNLSRDVEDFSFSIPRWG
jgi:glycosyltransferase involved in cell wall biosynthesis